MPGPVAREQIRHGSAFKKLRPKRAPGLWQESRARCSLGWEER